MLTADQCVLVIDDSRLALAAMEGVLNKAGFKEIATASSAHQALDMLGVNHPEPDSKPEAFQPDLILLDIIMPDMDGIEACRIMHSHKLVQDVPILIVTAKDDMETLKEAFDAGAMDYLTKPIKEVELLARINSALHYKMEADRRKEREQELLEMTTELAAANQRLRLLSSQDGLTEIANRRLFDHTLEHEWRRATRTDSFISAVLLDIDFFKLFNDQYGHLAGDNCLKKVARSLDANLQRAGDLLARYGGEEFVVLLPNTDGKGARHIAEVLRSSVQELEIPHSESTVAEVVTVSLGGCTMQARPGKPMWDLINLADQALYQSKNSGRNQITWHQGQE
jgi:diguanylate cyclase (GGDEF)-like protein